ncbi:hypothetical protein D3C73_683450 [compost metagenome]
MRDGGCNFRLHDLVRLRAEGRGFHVVTHGLPGVLLVLLRHIDRRQVVAPCRPIRQSNRLQYTGRSIAICPGSARCRRRCNAPQGIIGKADAAPIVGDHSIQSPTTPLVADPVAETINDLRRIKEDLFSLQGGMGDGVVGLENSRLVLACHHPVKVVFGPVWRVPQEALARLTTLERTEAGEEPPRFGIPRRRRANLRHGLARVSAACKDGFTASAGQRKPYSLPIGVGGKTDGLGMLVVPDIQGRGSGNCRATCAWCPMPADRGFGLVSICA